MRVRNSRPPVVLLTLAVLLISARVASAARGPHAASWVAVERLRPGQPISITFKDGAEAKWAYDLAGADGHSSEIA
jgi:hypothetical protein